MKFRRIVRIANTSASIARSAAAVYGNCESGAIRGAINNQGEVSKDDQPGHPSGMDGGWIYGAIGRRKRLRYLFCAHIHCHAESRLSQMPPVGIAPITTTDSVPPYQSAGRARSARPSTSRTAAPDRGEYPELH